MFRRSKQGKRLEEKLGRRYTVISPGNCFTGKLIAKDSIHVAGVFEGEIYCDQLIWIEDGGKIQGVVSARGVIVEGEISGDIVSAEQVEIRASGRVTGNIHATQIALAEGCFFEGEINMVADSKNPITYVEKRKCKSDEAV